MASFFSEHPVCDPRTIVFRERNDELGKARPGRPPSTWTSSRLVLRARARARLGSDSLGAKRERHRYPYDPPMTGETSPFAPHVAVLVELRLLRRLVSGIERGPQQPRRPALTRMS